MRLGTYLNGLVVLLTVAGSLFSKWSEAQTQPAAASTTTSEVEPEPMALASEVEQCAPSCRAGFTCIKAKCVSICNPPCDVNEVCTATAQCVARAPVPAPVFAATGPAGSTGMNVSTADVPPPKERDATIGGFSFVPRLGVQIGGSSSGTAKGECSGSFCSSITMADSDYELSKAVVVSFDFLFKVGELFRVGPGLMYTNTMDVYPSGQNNHSEFGNFTDLDFVAEIIPRVAPSVWLVPRAQFGVTAYNASGTAETAEKELTDACNSQTSTPPLTFSNCTGVESPHVGYNVGLGFGALFATGSSVRLRVDGLLSYYSFGLREISYTYDDGYSAPMSARIKSSTSGTRLLLLAGMEI